MHNDQPCNLEAEEAVLGSALIDPDSISQFSDVVSASDFYWHPHGWLWQAMIDLVGRGMQVDIVTVADELNRMGRLEDYASCDSTTNGTAAIMRLINATPTSMHAASYAFQVHDYAAKRKILALMNQGAAWALNGKRSGEIIGEIEKELGSIAVFSGATTNAMLTSTDAVKLAVKANEDAMSGKTKSILTGLIDLDNTLGGMHPGDLLLIAGRPGQGKTAFMGTVAVNAAVRNNKRVAIFSMEMPTEQFVNRMLAQLSDIPGNRIRDGRIRDDEWASYYGAVEALDLANIYFDDTPILSLPMMRQKMRKIADLGIDLVLVDQVNMMDAQMNGAKEHERINRLSYGLKAIAREFKVPVLAAHQMNRSVEGRRDDSEPQLSDLEQAGEKAADVVMFIVHEMSGERIKSSRIKVAKHRNGPVGSAKVVYLADKTRFENSIR